MKDLTLDHIITVALEAAVDRCLERSKRPGVSGPERVAARMCAREIQAMDYGSIADRIIKEVEKA